ncbi:MAG: response regulator [Bacteroidales bacterium]|nr:response regulator [Bacteroidales bacterium]
MNSINVSNTHSFFEDEGMNISYHYKDPGSKEKTDPLKSSFEGVTILIVEDENSNFLLLEAILKKTGANLLHAWNGKQAIELLDENPDIDLCLMDLKMPIMDGFEATEKIRETGNTKLPVIALTAFSEMYQKEIALEKGFNMYMTKPLNRKALMENISACL